MKKFLVILVVVLTISVGLIGCNSIDLKEKAVVVKGYASMGKIVPYDKINHAPSIEFVLANAVWSSIPLSILEDGQFYLFYDCTNSTSILNSNASDSSTTIVFAGDIRQFQTVKKALKYIVDNK